MDRLLYLLPALLGLVVGTVLCMAFGVPRRPIWIMAAAIYFVLDDAITLQAPHLPGTHWNWLGKAGAAILALVAARIFRMSRRNFGLRLPNTRRAWIATVLGTILTGAIGFFANYAFRDHQPASLETLCYEASMPGLAEEMNYRGILFVLVQRAFVSSVSWRQNLLAILIPSLVFAMEHGFSPDNGNLAFAWLPFAFALLVGLLLAFTRLLTASLLSVTLAHNVTNVAGNIATGLP